MKKSNCRHQHARLFMLLLMFSAVGLTVMIARPMWIPLFFAAVMAGTFHPLHERWSHRLGDRRGWVAGGLVCGALLMIVLPLMIVLTTAAIEIVQGARTVAGILRAQGVSGLLQGLPAWLAELGERALALFPDLNHLFDSGTLAAKMAETSSAAVMGFGMALSATGALLLQCAIFFIALFFFLLDGPRLVVWLEQISPLKTGHTTELLREFRTTAVSVLTSAVITSGAQSITAFVGYLIAGVPQPSFFVLITFAMALIPGIGAASVCLSAAALLLLTGKTAWAIFLAAWAVGPVGLVDNVLKPYLLKEDMGVHGAVIFFSLLGGLAVFGIVGLLVGPLSIACLLALLRIYQRDYSAHST